MKYRGNVGQLPSGRWQVRLKEHGAVTLASFDTQGQARRFAAAFKSRRLYAAVGIALPNDPARPIRLHDLLDEYLEGLEREQRSAVGIRAARQCLDIVRQFFRAEMDARRIGPETVREYWQWRLANRHSPKGTGGGAILHELAYLKAALRRGGLKPEMPVPHDLRRSVKRREKRIPTPAEIAAVLDAMPPESLERAFCEFLALTGARPGEARNIRWPELDLPGAVMNLTRPKVGTTRPVPLSPGAVVALVRWQRSPERTDTIDGRVFALDGRPLLDLTLRKRISRAARAARVPWFTPGTLRHAYTITVLNDGEAIQRVMEMLGHKRESTTMIYALRDKAKKAPTAMDKALKRSAKVIRGTFGTQKRK